MTSLHGSKQLLQTGDSFEPEVKGSVPGTSYFYLHFWHTNSHILLLYRGICPGPEAHTNQSTCKRTV